jgi:hypothetical protein
MANTGIKTKNYKYSEVKNFIDHVSSNTDQYYVFASHPTPWPNESFPPAPFESVDDSIYDTQAQMLFGKRVFERDVKPSTKRYTWQPDIVYDQYSNLDINLFDKQFYVITDERKVYKVLSNNVGKPSTIKPVLTQNSAFKTSDGYMWKYMYSVNETQMREFSTPGYMPVVANTNVQDSAKAGIDYIEVFSSGRNYLTYVTGTVQSVLSANCIQIDNFASDDNDFYNLSSIYITAGPGVGTLREITRYVSNTTGNFVYLNNYIADIAPVISKYRIAPTIQVVGDGSGAKAICQVSNNYGITNVTIIATGTGYTRASVRVVANSAYGQGANLISYVPPPGGHGANPIYELGVDALVIRSNFTKNEANGIPTELSYRRYGLLKNPNRFTDNAPWSANTFSSVLKIETTPTTTYDVGEQLQGDKTGSLGSVAFSNSTVTFLVGDKSFANAEIIRSLSSNVVTAISSVDTYGDIKPGSSDILYFNNTIQVPRSNTTSETVKIVYKF